MSALIDVATFGTRVPPFSFDHCTLGGRGGDGCSGMTAGRVVLQGVRELLPSFLLLLAAQIKCTNTRDASSDVPTAALFEPTSVGQTAKLKVLRSTAVLRLSDYTDDQLRAAGDAGCNENEMGFSCICKDDGYSASCGVVCNFFTDCNKVPIPVFRCVCDSGS